MSASRRVSSLKRIRYLLFAVFVVWAIVEPLHETCSAKLPPPMFEPPIKDGGGDEYDNVAAPGQPSLTSLSNPTCVPPAQSNRNILPDGEDNETFWCNVARFLVAAVIRIPR